MNAVSLLEPIRTVGRDRGRGGYLRHAFDGAEAELRAWFAEQAALRGLTVETDRNGNPLGLVGRTGPGGGGDR